MNPNPKLSRRGVVGGLTAATAAAAAGVLLQEPTLAEASPTSGVTDVAKSPSPHDREWLLRPPEARAPRPSDDTLRRNLMGYSEQLNSSYYSTVSAPRQSDTLTTGAGVTLTRITPANWYGSLRTQLLGNGLKILVPGNFYLMSLYVHARSSSEQWFWMRNLNSTGVGHGQRFVEPGQVVRAWKVVKAVDASTVTEVLTPSQGYASPGFDLYWFCQGTTNADGTSPQLDWYLGGFQLEDLGSTDPKCHIAAIGDSTVQGSSGGSDLFKARETMGYLAGLLNVTTFNRGIGGNRTDAMDARWDSDITPLAPLCKYVIIQGGINDIAQGRPLADIQASLQSMATKAANGGMLPVFLNCTPTVSISSDASKEQKRRDLNKWLGDTYARVVDIARVVADPYDPTLLRRSEGVQDVNTVGGDAQGWYGDGVHYTRLAKRMVAQEIALAPWWDFPTPSPYQRVTNAGDWDNSGLLLTSPNGTRYRVTIGDDGILHPVRA